MSGPLVMLFFLFPFSFIFKEFLPKIVRKVGAILFLFVLCFHFITLTFVIAMVSPSQYDSSSHSNIAQTRPNFYHIDSLTSFC